MEEVKEIKTIITGIQLNALETLPIYEKAIKKYVGVGNDIADAYMYSNRDALGAEYALITYDENVYNKYIESGLSADKYFDGYMWTRDIKSDKINGETIPYSLKENRRAALKDAGLSNREIEQFMSIQWEYKQ